MKDAKTFDNKCGIEFIPEAAQLYRKKNIHDIICNS